MQVYVFADWIGLAEPTLVGTLHADKIKGKEHFRFAYDEHWLTHFAQQIDPDLHLFRGEQHSQNAQNFRIFLDSCPDRWGRLVRVKIPEKSDRLQREIKRRLKRGFRRCFSYLKISL